MKKIENVHYLRDKDLPGIEANRVRATRHVFPKHAHDGIYVIGLMEHGGSWCLEPGNEKAFVAAGQVALFNPGQVHSGIPGGNQGITYRMLYIDMHWLADMAGDICEHQRILPEFKRIIVPDPGLFRKLIEFSGLICSDASRLHKQSAALESMVRLLSGHGKIKVRRKETDRKQRVVDQAKEILSEDLDRRLSLEAVASAVGLSRYHFLRLFKRQTGMPPHQFRTQRRIDAARRLIRKGLPFSQVALDVGFNDQSHFSNNFRKFIGATPSQYRSATRPARSYL